MRHPAPAYESLSAFRHRCGPLVSILTFAAFLFTLVPLHERHAEAATGPIPTSPDPGENQAPAGGAGSPSSAAAGASGAIGSTVELPVNNAGAFATRFPFRFPHARGVVQPSLALSYSSSTEWGLAGKGWNLSVPSITRSRYPSVNRLGLRTVSFDQERLFTHDGDELLHVCEVKNSRCNGALEGERMPSWAEGWHYYRPRVESKFDRYFLSSDWKTWRVQVKEEAVDYELGAALDGSHTAIEEDRSHQSPAKWWIVRAYDGTGDVRASAAPKPVNQVLYRYNERGEVRQNLHVRSGPLYLTDIYDTSPRSAPTSTDESRFAHHIRLAYEPRPDRLPMEVWGALIGYRTRRLARVDVTSKPFGSETAPRELLRRYRLTYISSPSLLRTVQLEGRCPGTKVLESNEALPETNCPKLPPTTYGYDDGLEQADLLPADRLGEIRGLEPVRRRFGDRVIQGVDINQDGFVDLLATATAPFPGQHVVWMNGGDGTAGHFKALPVTVRGVLEDTADTLAIGNPGTFLGDFDGNGSLEMLVAPPNQRARVYSLEPEGSAWSWVGRLLPQDLDLPADSANVRVADLDGNGTSDLLVTSTDGFRAYLSLARVPGGTGRFGTVDWSSGTLVLSSKPITAPIPRLDSGEAMLFSRSDVRLADMNGDHIADLVHVEKDGVRFWAGTSGGFGLEEVGTTGTATGRVLEDGFLALGADFTTDGNTLVRFGDVSGDGFDDLVIAKAGKSTVWLNDGGTAWRAPLAVRAAPAGDIAESIFQLADVRGRGRQDLVWWNVAGEVVVSDYVGYDGLLRQISNGYGATTNITYSLMTGLELARAGGNIPLGKAFPLWLATSIRKSDNLDLVGGVPNVSVNTYAFGEPYFRPSDQRFIGFRSITSSAQGDASHPTEHTRVTYQLGECVDDPDTVAVECGTDLEATGNPRAALAGRPRLVERFDDAGTYLETAHSTYRLRHLYSTKRGWTMHAFAERTDVYRYPTPNDGAHGSGSWVMTDVRIERTGTSTPIQETSRVPMRVNGAASLASESTVDAFGNLLETKALGNVGPDEVVRHIYQWEIPAGDRTGWMFRAARQWSVGGTAPNAPVTRSVSLDFDANGRLDKVRATLKGTLPLARSHEPTPGGGSVTPPAAPEASADGTRVLTSTFYDELGNATGIVRPNHRCLETTFDSIYGQLPTDTTQYLGSLSTTSHPVLGACGATTLKSFAGFDRGLERMTTSFGYHGEKATWKYDTFGRTVGVYKPLANAAGETSSEPALTFLYDFQDNVPLGRTRVQTRIVDTAGVSSARTTWLLTDGYQRTLATIDEADPSTEGGDGGAWIVRDVVGRNARGDVTKSYLPWFWNGHPDHVLVDGLLPSTAAARVTYDAFGRVLDTYAVDGTHTSKNEYIEALAYRVSDAEDLSARSLHANTPTTVRMDGFGRVISETTEFRALGTKQSAETRYEYDHDSNLVRIERAHLGTQDAPVVRTMAYDSLGRMVQNIEPNTSIVTGTGARQGWRYAYNDNGDLVGTSDARGCGKNVHFDAGGRVLAEDFWPCLNAQPSYTSPNLTTGEGTESFSRYDSLPDDAQAVLHSNRALTIGRLAVQYDRGSMTAYRYDGRGRTTGVARRMARPDANPTKLGERYASHWFVQENLFGEDERILSSTTGADVDDLLGAGRASTVSPLYSKRGTVIGLTSSYGSLIKSVKRSPEGLTLATTYGDAASTTTTTTYDGRLRPHTIRTERDAVEAWSARPPVISPPPTDATTTQLVLEAMEYAYDAIGNPTAIKDTRTASELAEWPLGAKPTSSAFEYDDLYRVTKKTSTYAGGTDTWTSPMKAETVGPVDDAKRDEPAPHRSFAKRVQSQTFAYDWLGNTTQTGDDAHGFYDRSLGTITNGTAASGPYQLRSASDPGHGNLATTYDASGNLTGLTLARQGECLPAGASCSQRFAYEWDEVGRLAHATRWDVTQPPRGAAAETLGADLRYVYDASGARVRKTSTSSPTTDRHTLYVFGSLELRRAQWFSGDNDYDRTPHTEVVRLAGIGRVVYADVGLPIASRGKQHVFLSLPGHLGSTGSIVDKETGELVEQKVFQPYGAAESDYRPDRWSSFREELGFTGKEEDVEVGLIYFGHRYLAPNLGRWASADPLTVHAAGADLNAYAYVGGHVARAVDPTGLQECEGSNCPKQEGGIGGEWDQPPTQYAPVECFEINSRGQSKACGAQAAEDAAGQAAADRAELDHERRAARAAGYDHDEAGNTQPDVADREDEKKPSTVDMGKFWINVLRISSGPKLTRDGGFTIGDALFSFAVAGFTMKAAAVTAAWLVGIAEGAGMALGTAALAATGVGAVVVAVVVVGGALATIASMQGAGDALNINGEQFGKKIGKHASDYGLNPGNPADRDLLRETIRSISNNPDKVVQGTFKGQEGLVDFFIKGKDVVIGKAGEFVTLMKDGINNPAVRRALGLP